MRLHRLRDMTAAIVLLCAAATAARAQDHGHHAHPAPKPAPGQSMPFGQLDAAGALHVVFVDFDGESRVVRYKRMFGGEEIESAISSPQENLSHWPESPPKLLVASDGTIHVLYTVRMKTEGAVDLKYTASRDGGTSWSSAESVGEVGVEVYRSCAAIAADESGRLVVAWLEGTPGGAAVAVRAALRRDGEFDRFHVDRSACECCATELMPADDGSVWLGYRDVNELNVRDLFVTRLMPEASRFQPPTRVSRDKWILAGCPDTGPRFTPAPADDVWAAWFSGSPSGVYAARARQSEPQFAERELVQALDPDLSEISHPAVGTLPDGQVLVVYACTRDGDERIEGRVRTSAGWSEPIRLGDAGEYPRIITNGQRAFLMYTATSTEAKTVTVSDLVELIRPSN